MIDLKIQNEICNQLRLKSQPAEKHNLAGVLKQLLNPYVTIGNSHPYHLDESILYLGASGLFFHFYFTFDEISVSKQYSLFGAILFANVKIGRQANMG